MGENWCDMIWYIGKLICYMKCCIRRRYAIWIAIREYWFAIWSEIWKTQNVHGRCISDAWQNPAGWMYSGRLIDFVAVFFSFSPPQQQQFELSSMPVTLQYCVHSNPSLVCAIRLARQKCSCKVSSYDCYMLKLIRDTGKPICYVERDILRVLNEKIEILIWG